MLPSASQCFVLLTVVLSPFTLLLFSSGDEVALPGGGERRGAFGDQQPPPSQQNQHSQFETDGHQRKRASNLILRGLDAARAALGIGGASPGVELPHKRF